MVQGDSERGKVFCLDAVVPCHASKSQGRDDSDISPHEQHSICRTGGEARLRLAYGRETEHGGVSPARLPSAGLSIWHQLAYQLRPHSQPDSFCCCYDNWLPSCAQGTTSSLDFPMGLLKDRKQFLKNSCQYLVFVFVFCR